MKIFKSFLFAVLTLSSQLSFASIEVTHARVREPMPNSNTSAAFMTIHNHGAYPLALFSAQSPQAKKTEIHDHIHQDGMMKMRPIELIDIPAKESVQLQTGGKHLMLFDVAPELKQGDTLQLKLDFSNGEVLILDVPVVKAMQHHHH